ncbi:MAG: outer membrane protein assembly factor BamB family protein [Mucilaginibacter sp.]
MNTKHNCLIPTYCLLAVICLGFFFGCKKADIKSVPPVPPVPPVVTDITGKIYAVIDDSISMVDANSGRKMWSTFDALLFNSTDAPLEYSDGAVFYGGMYGMGCYDAVSGHGKYQAGRGDPSAGNSSEYRVAAFVDDSLAILTNPTGVFMGGATLYCLNKFTGKGRWNQPADVNINGLYEYNPIPVIVNNKVVTLVKEWSGNFKITCFDPLTGAQIWETDYNPYLSVYLKANNGNVYCPTGQTVWCYSGADGSMLWQTTLTTPTSSQYASSWFDDKYLYIARINSDKSYSFSVLDKTSGAIISTSSLSPAAGGGALHFACLYKNGTLYVSDYGGTPVYNGTLYAYDFATLTLKWSYQFQWESTPPTAPIITDKYIMFPGGLGKTVDPNATSATMLFLTLNGKLAKTVKYGGQNTSKYLYVDNGVVYGNDPY